MLCAHCGRGRVRWRVATTAAAVRVRIRERGPILKLEQRRRALIDNGNTALVERTIFVRHDPCPLLYSFNRMWFGGASDANTPAAPKAANTARP